MKLYYILLLIVDSFLFGVELETEENKIDKALWLIGLLIGILFFSTELYFKNF